MQFMVGLPQGVKVVDKFTGEVEGGHQTELPGLVWVTLTPDSGGKEEPYILPETVLPSNEPGTRFGYAVVRDGSGVRGISYLLDESAFVYEPLL